MEFSEIEKLIRLLDETSIHEFKYKTNDVKIKIKKVSSETGNVAVVQSNTSQLPNQTVVVETEKGIAEQLITSPVKEEAKPNLHIIHSPMVGTFYAAPNPESEDFVGVGKKIEMKTVVCVIEAMKLFNEIEAEVEGEIVEILVQNGQLVEFGQPLFSVKKSV